MVGYADQLVTARCGRPCHELWKPTSGGDQPELDHAFLQDGQLPC